jgi:GT2 family glycosyltransferase
MPLVTAADASPVAVSVIVPSYNSSQTIRLCLASLARQECEAAYEVLVVDSSADDTPHLVAAEFPWVRLMHLPERAFAGRARNVGVRAARGAVMAFTDTDCIAPPDWLARHLRRLAAWPVVGGAVGHANPRSYVGWASYLIEFSGFVPSRRCEGTRVFAGANFACRRDLFDAVQFPDEMRAGEDMVFSWDASQVRPACLDGENVVAHINRSTLRSFLINMAVLGAAAPVVRRRKAMRGRIFLRYPVLLPLMPFFRVGAMFRYLLRRNAWLVFPALAALPLIFVGAVRWSWAFGRSAYRSQRSTVGSQESVRR